MKIPDTTKRNYKFSDLFAGIGGIRIGFESVGFKCVFSSEHSATKIVECKVQKQELEEQRFLPVLKDWVSTLSIG